MRINFRYIQKFLSILGLVLVVSFKDDLKDFPDNFPYQMWVEVKESYDSKWKAFWSQYD